MSRKQQFLGEFEQMVMLAILHLEDGAYTVPIREQIMERTGRSVSRGALYTTLERLEEKGGLAGGKGGVGIQPWRPDTGEGRKTQEVLEGDPSGPSSAPTQS
jgi:hypothetical protein